MLYRKMGDPWCSKGSKYVQEKNCAGKVIVFGQIELRGIIAKFHAIEQTNGEYLLRGTLRLISPATGKPLECAGAERRRRNARRKKENPASPVASCAILLKSLDQDEIKAHLIKKAKELIAANTVAIERACAEAHIQTDQTLVTLVDRYGTSFLRSKRLADNTFASQASMLARAASAFSFVPIAAFDEATVIRVQKSNNPLRSKEFNLLARFWQYCEENYTGLPENPFTQDSRLSKRQKRDGVKLANKRSTPNYLFPPQEHLLDPAFLDQVVRSPFGIVPILIKDAGLPISMIITLKWKDIIFAPYDPLYVRIRINKQYGGWTNDYTRPTFYLAAMALHILYDQSCKKPSPEQYILPLQGNRNGKKELTDYVRQCLLHLGVDRSPLVSAKNGNSKVAAGEQYLWNTYKHKIETQIGLDQNDPAAIRFLLGKPLYGDITADHYRSFTSDASQRRLYIAMRRWGTTVEKNTSRRVTKEDSRQDGIYRCSLTARDIEKKIISEFEVTLMPGESIDCRNNYGFEIDVTPMTDEEAPPPYVPYYNLQRIPDISELFEAAEEEGPDLLEPQS